MITWPVVRAEIRANDLSKLFFSVLAGLELSHVFQYLSRLRNAFRRYERRDDPSFQLSVGWLRGSMKAFNGTANLIRPIFVEIAAEELAKTRELVPCGMWLGEATGHE